MFERFTKAARDAVGEAERQAREMGTLAIAAEHLLLAVSDRVGIDPEGLASALADERRDSLAAVGVAIDPPERRPAVAGRTRFDASAKLALSRAVKLAAARRDRRIGAEHIALGVLEAGVGTVPRALEHAGLDRAALSARIG